MGCKDLRSCAFPRFCIRPKLIFISGILWRMRNSLVGQTVYSGIAKGARAMVQMCGRRLREVGHPKAGNDPGLLMISMAILTALTFFNNCIQQNMGCSSNLDEVESISPNLAQPASFYDTLHPVCGLSDRYEHRPLCIDSD